MPSGRAVEFWSKEATAEKVRHSYANNLWGCTALNGYNANGESFVKDDDDDPVGTPLFCAAHGADIGPARMLLQLGADPRRGDEDGIETPAGVARGEMERFLKQAEHELEDKPMLSKAEWATFLWQWAAEPPSSTGASDWLDDAVLGYYGKLLQCKNAYGDSGDTCTVDVIGADNGGKTALMAACAAGNLPAVKLLVHSFGADPTKVDNDQKPVCVRLPSPCLLSCSFVRSLRCMLSCGWLARLRLPIVRARAGCDTPQGRLPMTLPRSWSSWRA
eukprot:SAG22_NODE_1027_length_5962_cov_53.268293_4_plen_275_part_00